MSARVCESCGTSNPAGTSFCHHCRAFIGWDQTSVLSEAPSPPAAPGPEVEENIETRVIPKIMSAPDDEPAIRRSGTGPVPAARLDQGVVTVPVDGQRVELPLMITNTSSVVDGYEVDAGWGPGWLAIDSQPLRLLRGQEGPLVLGLGIDSKTLVAAGRGMVRLTALLAAALTVGLLVTIAVAGLSGSPGAGAVLIIIGAVLGSAGGLLARR